MDSIIVLSIVAGLLAIDDRAGWQSLLAQPVFAALLVGLIAGQVQPALAVGLVLEIIWLSLLPMRGLRRPDQTAGAVVGAGTTSLVLNLTADPRTVLIVAVGVVLGLAAGELAAKLTSPLYGIINRRLGNVDLTGSPPYRAAHRLRRLQAGAIASIFALESVVVFVLLMAGFEVAEKFTRYVDGSIVQGVSYWHYLMPALGAASLIHIYWHHHLKRVLILSAVIVTLVLWLR